MEQWNKIAIIGVGLLGGSLGLAIREKNLAKHVVGYVRRKEVIEKCKAMGIVEYASCDLNEIISEADFIILCTPILQMRSLIEKCIQNIKKGAIITDVGSAKTRVVSELEEITSAVDAYFIGSHPMAGSEKTGFEYASASLFKGAVCVVTPTEKSPQSVVEKVVDFWESVGARVLNLSPQLHDELVSRSSHLPHLVASQLVLYVLDSNYPKEQAFLCATGFRDTTRIASGSPEMWKDIVIVNKEQIMKTLEEFIHGLEELKNIIGEGNEEKIMEFFKSAKSLRDKWIAQNRE